jgi:uncharacterized membrane protein YeaQ/YmgE (transglycosylase-associated protein family)
MHAWRSAGDAEGVDSTDLAFTLGIGLLVGVLGHLVMPRRRDVPLWFTVLLSLVATVLGGVVADAIGVDESPGFEWAERTLQAAFAIATVLNVRTVAGIARVIRHR